MDRRDFLKTGVAVGILGAVSNPLLAAASKLKSGAPDLVAVSGGGPVEMFKEGIKALGGMEKFVKKGQTVVVKPNIGWAKRPDMAADTNPELVAEIVKSCFGAGAKTIYVFDHTCNNWKTCYNLSGIQAAAETAGAQVMPGNAKGDYRNVEVPKGKVLKKGACHKLIMDCDVFINVPILKNHGGSIMTAAMKNLMGTVWDRRFFHKNGLQQCIVDWCTYRVPDLNIIDAYRMMRTHGPRGIGAGDVVDQKMQLLSTDIVAIDTAASKILGKQPSRIPYLKMGQKLGLGTTDLASLNIKKIKV